MTDFNDASISNTETDNDPFLQKQMEKTLKFHLQTQNTMEVQKDLVIEVPPDPEENDQENEQTNENRKPRKKSKNNMILIPDFFMH